MQLNNLTLQTYWPLRGSTCGWWGSNATEGAWSLIFPGHTSPAIRTSRVHFMREKQIPFLFKSLLFGVFCYAPLDLILTDLPNWESKLITQFVISRKSKTKFCPIYMYAALLPKSKTNSFLLLFFLYIKWVHGSFQQNRPKQYYCLSPSLFLCDFLHPIKEKLSGIIEGACYVQYEKLALTSALFQPCDPE